MLKIKLLYLFLGLLLGGLMVYGFMSVDILGEPTFTMEKLYFPQSGEHLYLKKLNWGITGDSQILAISKDDSDVIDKNSKDEYILEGLQEIFYKQNKDTLTLYVRNKFKIPKFFNTKVIIRQVVLENPEFEDLFNKAKSSFRGF